MTDIKFSSDMTVKLIRHMGGDESVIQAAQVSAKGENNPDTVPERLINALLKGKHGSPFEHNASTFFVEAPIFVFREWHRHRIASINEMSGRYTELPGKFYIPDEENRKIINAGSKMKPEFVNHETDTTIVADYVRSLKIQSDYAWRTYQAALARDVAPEVARMVLPVNIYSQMYWTVNARSLMNFLSLRSSQEGAAYVSYPQREIQIAAEQIEAIFAEVMPLTYQAFINNGRVAP